MKLSNQKGRAWAFVMYPESMPENFYEILEQTGLPFALSPLHDKDLDPTGEPKKPHYHVICYYDNTTTKKNVKENVCDIVNATIPIKLESMRGMYRYHLHLDNPDKYQYDDRDRTFINCFEVSKVAELTSTEVTKIIKELQSLIIDNDITEYSELMDLLLGDDLVNMYDVAQKHTIFINTYITSRRHKFATKEKIKEAKRKEMKD